MTNVHVQFPSIQSNTEINGIIENITSSISKYFEGRRCSRCKDNKALQQILYPLMHDLTIATTEQYQHLIQAKGVNDYLESKFVNVLDTSAQQQREMQDLIQKQQSQLEDLLRNSTEIRESCASAMTYAEKLKTVPSVTTLEAPPVILIDSVDSKKQASQIRNSVRKITHEKRFSVKPTDVYLTQKNRMILRVTDRATAETYADKLSTILPKEEFKISLPPVKRRRVNILRVPSSITKETICDAIADHLLFIPEFCAVVYEYPEKLGHRTVTVEIDNRSMIQLLQRPKLCVDFTSLKVEPYVRVIRCLKCQDFGHFARNCRKDVVCMNCAGSHKTEQCKVGSLCCLNCKVKKHPHGHRANSNQCKSFHEVRNELMNEIWDYVDNPFG